MLNFLDSLTLDYCAIVEPLSLTFSDVYYTANVENSAIVYQN